MMTIPMNSNLNHSSWERVQCLYNKNVELEIALRRIEELWAHFNAVANSSGTTYGLPLGYFSDDLENQIPYSKDGNKSVELKKGLISYHRCLIYIGDLARYKGLYGEGDSKACDFAAATSYYLQASSLWTLSACNTGFLFQ
ncbi:hypothetical protein P3S67_007716 [Capsicum chacoense]